MAENNVKFYSRTYDEYKNDVVDLTRRYYPMLFDSLDDASIGKWFINVISDIGDNLSNAIDHQYQETNLDTARELSSLKNIARTYGINLPGRKAAIVEVELSCNIPLINQTNISMADEDYAPFVKRGALFSTGSQTFELMEDVDFKNQFDRNGISNRKMYALRNSDGNIIGYRYSKLAIAYAGQSKIYKKIIEPNDIKPFMEITLPDKNILNVESIIIKQGMNISNDPNISEFFVDRESYEDIKGNPTQRYFEVENLIDPYRFGYEEEEVEYDENNTSLMTKYYQPIWDAIDVYEVDGEAEPARLAMKGRWKRLKNKFITEFNNDGTLKITFGAGIRNKYGEVPTSPDQYTQYLMTRMYANDAMGVVPEPNTTMYILYRVGGGEESNIAKNTLNNITFINTSVLGDCNKKEDINNKAIVRGSLRVTNPSPSYGGRDSLSSDEIRYFLKYAVASQNRCVTVHDYFARLSMIEPKFGLPFRIGIVEENNKICIYTLGLDYRGKLLPILSETVSDNMKEYLSKYRCINDFVEVYAGRVINLSFEVDVFIDKMYDKSEVSKRIIDLVNDYMDIRRHQMGEDIFLGDLEKEISKLDGVVNLIELRCYNKFDDGYSNTKIAQEVKYFDAEGGYNDNNLVSEIDLKSSDKLLIGSVGSMFEIKYPERDIKINVKER